MVDGETEEERQQERFNLKNASAWIRNQAIQHARPDGAFVISEGYITLLHLTIATNTSIKLPGQYRDRQLQPLGKHQPPSYQDIPKLMCEFVYFLNKNWRTYNVAKIGAYSLWRLNWIHPFCNGNGRTSRLFSYFLMNMKAGHAPLPGKDGYVVPQLLAEQYRKEYEQGLMEADQKGDISYLETVIADLLRKQILSVYDLSR